MTYNEVLEKARANIGPYCKACPVCNGKACGNAMPGPGSKNPGNGAARNYDAWQRVYVNMDTIMRHDVPTPASPSSAASSACPSSPPP